MIRPVEMQMLLPRTESVGSTQQYENQKVVNENAYAANEVQREVKQNSETVIRKDANEFAEYQYDAKEEGNGTYQDPRKRRSKAKNANQKDENSDQLEVTGDKQPRINIQI